MAITSRRGLNSGLRKSARFREVLPLLFFLSSTFIDGKASAIGTLTPADGRSARYWQQNSCVFAEVIDYKPDGTSWHAGVVDLRIFGTLSGSFDAGNVTAIRSEFDFAGDLLVGIPVSWRPVKKGDKVLAVLFRDGAPNWSASGDAYRISSREASFMPPFDQAFCEPVVIVGGYSDPLVGKTLATIRERRRVQRDDVGDGSARASNRRGPPKYWESHSVVFGPIAGSTAAERAASIDFRPILRLTGDFDPGLVANLDCRVDLKTLAADQTALPAGNALLLLVRDGDSYSVASERADFMPGDHFPICSVKDFADPKVAETLKKIQDARAKEKRGQGAGDKGQGVRDSGFGTPGSGTAAEKTRDSGLGARGSDTAPGKDGANGEKSK
jgi:hypothetical protein